MHSIREINESIITSFIERSQREAGESLSQNIQIAIYEKSQHEGCLSIHYLARKVVAYGKPEQWRPLSQGQSQLCAIVGFLH